MKTKICGKCKEEKDVNFFYLCSKSKKPVSPCKKCKYIKSLETKPLLKIDKIINLEGEDWIAVNNYETRYHISNLGRLKSLNYNHTNQECLLKHNIDKDGYYTYGLFDGKKQTTFKAHRLVAIHFIPNPLNLPEVNHKKGIKSDNRASELEWSTTADNIRHSLQTGLKIMPKGEESSLSKLTETQVLEIRNIHKNNRKGYVLTAKQYNVSVSLISAIVNRKIWKHLE